MGYAADRRPSTHPVAGNGAADAASALDDFDGISYAKGASVLRQLALHLGDDVFLGGLRDYIDRYANGNAELRRPDRRVDAAGATDLDAWAEVWLRTTGLDELSVADGSLVRTTAGDTPRMNVPTRWSDVTPRPRRAPASRAASFATSAYVLRRDSCRSR